MTEQHTEQSDADQEDQEQPTAVRPGDRTVGDQRRDAQRVREMFQLVQFPQGHTNQARYLRNVREMGREFALMILENTPRCADQSAAIRCVREAVKWSEEAILRDGLV